MTNTLEEQSDFNVTVEGYADIFPEYERLPKNTVLCSKQKEKQNFMTAIFGKVVAEQVLKKMA